MGGVTDAETTRTPSPSPGDEPVGQPETPAAQPAIASSTPSPPPHPAQPQAWRPPVSDSGRNASLIFGAIILILGVWFFATNTLGLDLPDLDWGQLWPIILIAIGGWIVLTAMRQRAR